MDITFTPPLVSQVRLSIPYGRSTTVLNFTAALSSAHHAQLIRDSAKLQLWSDVCLNTDKFRSAEWCAFDFQTPTPTAIEVSLRNSTQTNDSQHGSLLSLQLTVPLASPKYIFSFTYRLVYPTGDIRWLGQYGQNGTVVLEQSQSDFKFILYEGWSMKNGGYSWTHSGESVDNLEVARLSPSDYFIQSIGRGRLFNTDKASLAFLVPRVLAHSVMLDPTYTLSASPDLTFSVSSSGVITASGSGSLLLQAPGSNPKSDLRSLVNNAIVCGPSDLCEVATLDTNAEYLLLTSGLEGRHLKALLLPTIAHQGLTRVALNKLAALLSDEVMQYSIFSPLNSNIHFFSRPAENSNQDIQFLMDPPGGPFVLSSAFHLESGQCQISIISDYRSIKFQSDITGTLPTPPPSPHLHPTLSFSEPSSISRSISSDPDTSFGPSLRISSSADRSTLTKQIDAPTLKAVILTYIISTATYLFTSLYQLFFGRHISEWDTGHTDEKEPRLMREEVSTVTGEIENRVAPETSEVLQHPNSSPHSLLVETHGGKFKAALRFTGVAISTALITVDLNGCKVDPTFTKLDEYILFIEVDGGRGGLIKITIA